MSGIASAGEQEALQGKQDRLDLWAKVPLPGGASQLCDTWGQGIVVASAVLGNGLNPEGLC